MAGWPLETTTWLRFSRMNISRQSGKKMCVMSHTRSLFLCLRPISLGRDEKPPGFCFSFGWYENPGNLFFYVNYASEKQHLILVFTEFHIVIIFLVPVTSIGASFKESFVVDWWIIYVHFFSKISSIAGLNSWKTNSCRKQAEQQPSKLQFSYSCNGRKALLKNAGVPCPSLMPLAALV